MNTSLLIKTGAYAALLLVAPVALTPAIAEPSHAIAMHGAPALPADFVSFPYANPNAPKGGAVTYCVIGTFDNLNPFILKSMRTTARGMIDSIFGNLVYQPLMERSRDEAFTMYPLIAESVETDPDRTWIEFTLNADAKWSDGTNITPEDVIFSYETYEAKGRPPYSSRLGRVEKMEVTAPNKVKFTFNEQSNREYPLIIALTPIIPKHATNLETFEETSLDAPIGSGPYIVSDVQAGQSITFERNKDYWGANVGSNAGFFNYDSVKIEYFRNDAAMFEAFKSGLCDIYFESDPGKWQNAYNFPAVENGDIVKSEFTNKIPTPMIGFALNTRREIFADKKVRQALTKLYDFEWANTNLYLNQFKRINGYWENSELSSIGVPVSEGEKALLGDDIASIDADVLDGTYLPSQTDGSGRDRTVYRDALALLTEAGYSLSEGKLLNGSGTQFAFELLVASAEQETMALALQRNAEKIGIAISIRSVDDAQIQQRKQTYDYDVIVASIGFSGSLSPGLEQYWRWGSASRVEEGSFNYAGVADPAVDRMIDALVNATDRDEFTDAVRALDRLLISGYYMIPLQYKPTEWIAHSSKLAFPETTSLYGAQMMTWWAK